MERLRREADASVSAKVDGGGGGDPMELGTPRQPRVGAGGGVLGEGVDVRKMSSLEGGLGEVRVKVLEEAYEVSSQPDVSSTPAPAVAGASACRLWLSLADVGGHMYG
eukprot:360975-Rhodomonas_salina.2